MTPEEKILDRNYRKKFNWTLAEVDVMFAAQDNRCKICHRPRVKNRLSVDHDHAFDRAKIVVQKYPLIKEWLAVAHVLGKDYSSMGATRTMAKDAVRNQLRRASVRGGLCFLCNGGIQKFEDLGGTCQTPPEERFDAAARYLREFKSRSLSEQK